MYKDHHFKKEIKYLTKLNKSHKLMDDVQEKDSIRVVSCTISSHLLSGKLIVESGTKIGEYTIIRKLGEGTFGTVVEGMQGKNSYAIKVIRNIPKFKKVAFEEINVLRKLSHKHIINLLDAFECSTGHIIMVFPLHRLDIFKFMKKHSYRFRVPELKIIVKQLASTITYVHSQGFIHTDVKPENILFVDDTINTRKKIANINIKLIDFGTAVSGKKLKKGIATTRHYRAPEVMLGLFWSYPIDIWSFATIILELYAGQILFETHNSIEHLAMIEQILGPIPYKGFGDQSIFKESFFLNGKLRYPEKAPTEDSVRFVTTMKPLKEIVLKRHPLLLDLLTKMLRYKPEERITAEQILKHPFLTGKPLTISKPTATEVTIETINCNIITDLDGRLIVKSGTKVGKYIIIKELGRGTYGIVVEASFEGKLYAIKVMNRGIDEANEGQITKVGLVEIQILKKLNHPGIIRLVESFKCSTGQIIMVFPKYSYDLNEFMIEEEYEFDLVEIKVIIRQVTSAIAYMHKSGFIHTDLKPENIMLVDSSLNERRRLNEIIVKLIDLGNTHRKIDPHSKLITTAPYRSPEVILGLPWSYPTDIWSFAIIIIQLHINNWLIFEYQLPIIHLAMMERILGPIPYKGFADRTESSRSFFKSGKLKFPEPGHSRRTIVNVGDSIPLEEMGLPKIPPLLLDLLKKMLKYRPEERITAAQILKHPFLTGETISIPTPETISTKLYWASHLTKGPDGEDFNF